MNGSRKPPNQDRRPVKQLPTAAEYRAKRQEKMDEARKVRRHEILQQRRNNLTSTFPGSGGTQPHSPFTAPFSNPFSTPQHSTPFSTPFSNPFSTPFTTPFSTPQHSTPLFTPPPLHQPLQQQPRQSSTSMEIETHTPHTPTPSSPLTPMTLPQTHAPQPTVQQTPEQVLGMSQQAWAKFSERSATENRRDVMGLPAPVHRPSPELSNFLYDKGGVKLDHQVKYGPGAGIDTTHQGQIDTHYGAKTKPRLTQYSSNRNHYVRAANESGRPLTHQEFDVSQGRNPGPTSINHVIASGTGQNLMNQMTMQFDRGVETFDSGRAGLAKAGIAKRDPTKYDASKLGVLNRDRLDVLGGIAQQAAAVGRMTGIGRAIVTEEAPLEVLSKNPGGAQGEQRHWHLGKRDAMAKNVLSAFQAPTLDARYSGYKSYLKSTFDSFGNLRLGHGTGNGRVSTGIDIPLTSSMTPTPRGERLYQANLTFGLPHMETAQTVSSGGASYRSGFFTTTSGGLKLTSSTEK
ncbi:hypothetical protein LFL96_32445 [Paraburkholderia sp. D15]|uniref:hypothetical protein n=1 Tax=Paraburkholderia sp. D15 TaxID=2880218 RepID=UPI00247A93BE|nr:hypothetical protein [Paraburkholderia sp. D15]WGS52885.1 hypothetical protein LFL96_32445 [Paraburkholderia sp. D15]